MCLLITTSGGHAVRNVGGVSEGPPRWKNGSLSITQDFSAETHPWLSTTLDQPTPDPQLPIPTPVMQALDTAATRETCIDTDAVKRKYYTIGL